MALKIEASLSRAKFAHAIGVGIAAACDHGSLNAKDADTLRQVATSVAVIGNNYNSYCPWHVAFGEWSTLRSAAPWFASAYDHALIYGSQELTDAFANRPNAFLIRIVD